MRTFHTGGVAGDDITQGLPRVEELFEARKPKKMSVLSEISGTVSLEETRKNTIVAITVVNHDAGEIRVYQVPYSAGIRVKAGDIIEAGTMLTDGALNPTISCGYLEQTAQLRTTSFRRFRRSTVSRVLT